MSTKRLNIDILAKDKTKQALSGVQKNLSNVKNTVFSLKGALVGLGAGAVIKSFVDVGKEAESLQVRFKFLFGSVEEGQVAFDNLTKFASKVPFSLEEISRASGNLAVVADDANDLNRILEITGNVASVTGLDFETTASQIQRAFSGGIASADIFRERGVRALLGFKQGATVTAEETVAKFEELFAGDGRFANATDDLATTLEGTLSMIGDKYFKFQKDVASGFFDELKGEFGDLNTFLEENEQQIKDIATAIGENFAGALTTTSDLIKAVAPSVKTIADALGTTIEGFKSLPQFVQTTGIIGALLFGKKGAIAFAGVSFLVGQIQELVERSKELEGLELTTSDVIKKEVQSLEDANEQLGYYNDLKETFNKKTQTDEIEKTEKIIEELEKLKGLYQSNANELDFFNRVAEFQIGMTDEQIEKYNSLNTELGRLGAGYNYYAEEAKKANIEQEKQNKLQEKYDQAIRKGTLGNVNTELGRFKQIMADNSELIDSFNETKFPKFIQTLENAGDTTLQLDTLFTNTFNGFADTLADAILTGKFAFKDFANAVVADIARIIAKQLALLAVQKTLGFLGGGFLGGIGSIFGGFFADGGRPPINRPSIVGEAGPELFVPDTAGTIIPNNKLGGATTVNVNVYANDTQGFDDLLVKRRSVIVNVINDALNSQGKEALV